MKFNPFKPNSIVGPGMFAGRDDELDSLEKALFQTKNGNPWHFLIHGERGIGKSSLLFYMGFIAAGEASGHLDGRKYQFLTIPVEIEPHLVYRDVIQKIGRSFARQLKLRERVRTAAKGLFDFVTRWEIGGIKYSASEESATDLIDELCDSFAAAIQRLGDDVDGILILIDEADKAGPETHLGEVLKLLTERLTKRRCDNVVVGVSGVSSVLEILKRSHESSLRILNQLKLEPLHHSERLKVIESGLREANAKSSEKITIRPDAADWIAKFSEGYPHFIQQYAYSAFDTDTDNDITIEDVHYGAFKENGAVEQLGMRYFEDMYLDQIASDEYRQVLQVMAESPDKYIARKHIKQATGLKETTLTNALAALKKKQIILSHREKNGMYCLPTDSFAVWIRAKARREQEQAGKSF